jgi:isopenicillin N synthase-like dioxygenase
MIAMTSSTSLPIIDVAPLLDPHNTVARAATSAALHEVCIGFGFFYLNVLVLLDTSEPEELVRLARKFFSLPQDSISLSN